MLSRRAKAAFYFWFGPAMKLSGWIYRKVRSPKTGVVKVHLGPGQKKYLEGWINVDANMFTGRCDVWADFRNKLPFRDNTVDAVYSHHMIEHLPDLPFHFREMFRVLKPGGIIRVGGPHGDNAIKKFQEGDTAWFSDFPESRESIGGRFDNFILCSNEHLAILTTSWLRELADKSGFGNIEFRKPTQETGHPTLIDNAVLKSEEESTYDCPHTIIIEAQKPHEG